ncbi:hypothetical protein [Thermofilum pendens]|nr:hypothetical protein [Thermofilum pendens]
MSSDGSLCMVEGCSAGADILLEVRGQQLLLCKTHFKDLVSRLAKAAEKEGKASLLRLKVQKTSDGKVRLLIRRKVSRATKKSERKTRKKSRKKGKSRSK